MEFIKDHLFEVYVIVAVVILVCISAYRFMTNQYGRWCRPFRFGSTSNQPLPAFPTLDSSAPGSSKGEAIVQDYMCRRFHRPFTKVRNILNPVTGQFMELDCYNADLRLGVEYQGVQHYKYTPFFHKTIDAFRNQQYRDELKRIYCRDAGIALIHVPYTVKHADIPLYIEAELQRYRIQDAEGTWHPVGSACPTRP